MAKRRTTKNWYNISNIVSNNSVYNFILEERNNSKMHSEKESYIHVIENDTLKNVIEGVKNG